MSLTTLITGANRGLGLALTHACLRRDDNVIACCRTPYLAHQLHKLAEIYPKLAIHQLDVSEPEEYLQLKEALAGTPIDWLIANAGLYGPQEQALGQTDYHAWQQVLAVNTLAPLRLVETFMENLRAGDAKSIAVISSVMGSISENHQGGHYLYRSSKAALNAVLRSLALDLAAKGIKAYAMHPGWVKTDMGGQAAPLEVEDAASTLLLTLERLDAASSGKFISYDGQQLPW